MPYLCKFEPGEKVVLVGKIKSISVINNDDNKVEVGYKVNFRNFDDGVWINPENILSIDNKDFLTMLPDDIIIDEFNRRRMSNPIEFGEKAKQLGYIV